MENTDLLYMHHETLCCEFVQYKYNLCNINPLMMYIQYVHVVRIITKKRNIVIHTVDLIYLAKFRQTTTDNKQKHSADIVSGLNGHIWCLADCVNDFCLLICT